MTHEGDSQMFSTRSPLLGTRSAVASAALALLAAGAAHAQTSSDAPPSSSIGTLEEVVITSTKRDVSQQEVPIAISTVTARDLQNQPLNDIRALANLAPGLVLSNPAGFNAAGGGMRGTGTNIILTTQDAPVSFIMDEFVLSQVTSQFLQLFDVEQIEVLRGPQGTLQGKNTTGGVIFVRSKRPVLGEYSAETQIDFGQWDRGGSLRSLKAAVNLPLSETFALRFSAMQDDADGYYSADKATATFPDNVPLWQAAYGIPAGTPVNPSINTTTTGTGERLGGKDVFAGKAKALWRPNDVYEANFIYEAVRDDSDSPPGVNESISTDLLTALGFPGIQLAGQKDVFSTLITNNGNGINERDGHQVDADGYYLDQTFTVAGGAIKSFTGYREQTERLPSTYTGESFMTLFDSTRNTERYTFQQELRFASEFDGAFNFVAGANYFKDSFNNRAFFSVGLGALAGLIPCGPGGSFVGADGYVCIDPTDINDYQFQGTSQNREEYAGFFNGTLDLTERWSIEAGARYSKDKKEFLRFVDGGGPCNEFTRPQDVVAGGPGLGQAGCRDVRSHFISRAGMVPNQFDQRNIPLPVTAFGTTVPGNATSYDDRITAEFSKPTYRAALRFKPADSQMIYLSWATGFLSGGFSETCATPSRCAYNPETNENFELGYKADLFDNTLRFNGSVFFTTYEDLQRAVVATYTQATGVVGQETVTVNTGKADVKGVDLEATWVPQDNLSIDVAMSYLDTKYKNAILPDLRGSGAPQDISDLNLPFSPDFKAQLGVTYDVGLSSGARLTLNGSVNYQSEAETDVFNGVNTQMEERTLLNSAVTYHDREDRWFFSVYGTNLTDEVYRIAALPVAGLWNFTNYGPPRQYGMSLGLKFE